MLVSREMNVPGEEDGGARWSLDHLFLDQDAIPTLVEVKRSTDTRIRRAVWTYGSVELQFQHMKTPPFAEERKREELGSSLSAIGLSIPAEALNKRPSFGLGLLKEPADLTKFLEAFDWVLSEIKKSENCVASIEMG